MEIVWAIIVLIIGGLFGWISLFVAGVSLNEAHGGKLTIFSVVMTFVWWIGSLIVAGLLISAFIGG